MTNPIILFLIYAVLNGAWTAYMSDPDLRTKSGDHVRLHTKITGQWKNMQTETMRAHVRRYERVKVSMFLLMLGAVLVSLANGYRNEVV